jgi:ribonuclease G
MAVVSGGELVDYAVDEPGAVSIVGNIYKGLVTNVLPGTQNCFVNIGLEKNAVLYVGDVLSVTGGQNKRPIETLVKSGQKIIVQALRDATGDKGAFVTTRLALPGKYAVLLPGAKQCSVSRRITDLRETGRLRDIAAKLMPEDCGMIIRTGAAGAAEDRIAADVKILKERYAAIKLDWQSDKIPDCIHTENDFFKEVIFRAYESDISRVITDDRDSYSELLGRSSAREPDLSYKIQYYGERWPLFAYYGVQHDIDNLKSRKVWLKCGAYIIIEHTEAMTVVDVNTGKYGGADSQRETFLRVNREAVVETARQLRLRDIGGIIVIDALRMNALADQREVVDALNTELKNDRQKTVITGFTKLGLLELTRKKTRAGFIHAPGADAWISGENE